MSDTSPTLRLKVVGSQLPMEKLQYLLGKFDSDTCFPGADFFP